MRRKTTSCRNCAKKARNKDVIQNPWISPRSGIDVRYLAFPVLALASLMPIFAMISCMFKG